MRQAVRDNWLTYNRPLEGRLPFMYLDIRGLVTTGIGNLIDRSHTDLPKNVTTPPTPAERAGSIADAANWRWLTSEGTEATPEQVAEDWDAVKARTDLAAKGGGHFKGVGVLHVGDDEIDAQVLADLDKKERYLKGRPEFAAFDGWPADGQLALLSMAWGMGAAFNFPKFQGHAAARDWGGMSAECRFNPDAGTIRTRNDNNQVAFLNAGRVEAEGLDPDSLLLILAGAGLPMQPPIQPPVQEPGRPDLGTAYGVQHALQLIGYNPGTLDGILGEATRAAVRAFQADNGLTADGIAGPLTLAALAAALEQVV